MELAKIIMESARIGDKLPQLRISLYGSPAFLEPGAHEEEKILADKSRNVVLKIHQQIRPGALYALARIASVLALDVNHYALDYAGGIVPEGMVDYFDIYSVEVR